MEQENKSKQGVIDSNLKKDTRLTNPFNVTDRTLRISFWLNILFIIALLVVYFNVDNFWQWLEEHSLMAFLIVLGKLAIDVALRMLKI